MNIEGLTYQERIIMRSNLGSREARPIIKSNTKATWHPEHIDGPSVGPEVMCWVLGRDTTLHCIGGWLVDGVLCQAKLGKSFA